MTLVIRDAKPADAGALAALIAALGYEVTEAEIGERLIALDAAAPKSLVAVLDGAVIGCLTLSIMRVLHRPKPVGRISMLVVDENRRGAGIGARLVAAAEERLRALGCGLIEVTSNVRRERAHAFYERLGYERTSYRFARTL
jgi:predicted N-acetyltransferase YhbS